MLVSYNTPQLFIISGFVRYSDGPVGLVYSHRKSAHSGLAPRIERFHTGDVNRYSAGHNIVHAGASGLLVEANRVEEAVPLLLEVLAKSECPVDQVITSAFLAKAHRIQKNDAEAKRWLEKARAIDAAHPVVRRIEGELGLGIALPVHRDYAARVQNVPTAGQRV